MEREDAGARGTLVADYLREEPAPKPYLDHVAADAEHYNGFNLLLGTPTSLYYLSNREGTVRPVEPGLHGLSNDHLDTPWPKVRRAKQGLQAQIEEEAVTPEGVLELLDDRRPAPDNQLPDTGFGKERERMLSPIFINGEQYGTRASTVLFIDREGTVTYVERTYNAGVAHDTRRFFFEIPAPSNA